MTPRALNPVTVSLQFEHEPIEAWSLYGETVPDRHWHERDDHAHDHRWTDDGELPTLEKREIGTEYVGDEIGGFYPIPIHGYFCRECGDSVSPRWITIGAGERKLIPGPLSAHVTIEERLPDGHGAPSRFPLTEEQIEQYRTIQFADLVGGHAAIHERLERFAFDCFRDHFGRTHPADPERG